MSDSKRVWTEAERALLSGDADALAALLRAHPTLFTGRRPPPFGPEPGRLSPSYAGSDARTIVVENHHFASWEDFERWQRAMRDADSPVARFERAVDAIVDGDVTALDRLLADDAALIRARSIRTHRSTLLHYVGANGIEAFRQKTPGNAPAILRLLLDAGADVDAPADMYGGGSKTLGLVATSIHPMLAGVQDELMGILLERGARLDDESSGGNQMSAVAGCLANGRPGAAEYLARRGARLDLDTAAGVGDLAGLRRFFDDAGRMTADATPEQLKRGMAWACQYGRLAVVEFLLRHGAAPGDRLDGTTALHWAGYGGHTATVVLLLAAGAPVNARDGNYDGTPLGWTLYGWTQRRGRPEAARYYDTVRVLANAGATVASGWLRGSERGYPIDDYLRRDRRMTDALRATRRVQR